MQGTSLEDAYTNFTALPLSHGNPFHYSDLSGSALFDILQQTKLQSITEVIPKLDAQSLRVRALVDDFKNLRQYHKYLTDEIRTIETTIRSLEKSQQKFEVFLEEYTNQILHHGILSQEEFEELQAKQKEHRQVQRKATEKCLAQYKEQATSLYAKDKTTVENMASYTEFLRLTAEEIQGAPLRGACSVCYEAESNHCLVPCGHTFCESCLTKNQSQTCMACRTPIEKKVKMFL